MGNPQICKLFTEDLFNQVFKNRTPTLILQKSLSRATLLFNE